MQASVSLVVGLLLGWVAYLWLGPKIDPENPSGRPSALAWAGFGFGLIAFLIVASGLIFSRMGLDLGRGVAISPAVSIGLAFAGVVDGVGAWMKGDRHWPTWAAFGVAGLPALFWVVFAVGELVVPH